MITSTGNMAPHHHSSMVAAYYPLVYQSVTSFINQLSLCLFEYRFDLFLSLLCVFIGRPFWLLLLMFQQVLVWRYGGTILVVCADELL